MVSIIVEVSRLSASSFVVPPTPQPNNPTYVYGNITGRPLHHFGTDTFVMCPPTSDLVKTGLITRGAFCIADQHYFHCGVVSEGKKRDVIVVRPRAETKCFHAQNVVGISSYRLSRISFSIGLSSAGSETSTKFRCAVHRWTRLLYHLPRSPLSRFGTDQFAGVAVCGASAFAPSS